MKPLNLRLSAKIALASCTILGTAFSASSEDFLTGGEIDLSLRYRLAVIDQDSFENTATASTLQTLLGVKSGKVNGFYVYGQLRNVTNVGTDRFNSTINGRTNFPVEADPEATEIDQGYLAYAGIKNTLITVGRRKLAWGNKRFVSKLAWRQNQRSFDGVTIESKLSDSIDFKYSYAFNVNRAFTNDSPVGNFDANVHLANLTYDLAGIGKTTLYGYSLDMNDAFAQALSTRTIGANFTGSQPIGDGVKFGYTVEIAHQKDIKDNPFDIGVGYFRVEPSLQVSNIKLRAGYEILGGNGERGFQTPLALLHAFNGWADQFVVTPANGLRDFYAEAKYKVSNTDTFLDGTNFTVSYHDFQSDIRDQSYGSEIDAAISTKLFGKVTALAKIAVYNADEFSTDTTKFWFQLSTSF